MRAIQTVLAVIGVLAILAGGFMMVKMPGMMALMPGMMSEGMKPLVEVINENPDGLVRAAKNLSDGAAEETATMMRRWVESEGEIAYTTTWERKVEEGITLEDVADVLNTVAVERNIKDVGQLPLSEELQARGIESGVLKIFSYCNPETARKMVDFAPHMGAYLPCRIVVVEREDGLWLYTLNMDMMLKMGQSLDDNPELKEAAWQVRDTIWEMMDRAARGAF